MKKRLIGALLMLVSFLSISQESSDTVIVLSQDRGSDSNLYQSDTTVFSSTVPAYLVGSAKFPSSHNQLSARHFDVCFQEFTVSDCGDDNVEYIHPALNNRIQSVEETDSTYTVVLSTIANCCFHFLGDIGKQNDTIVNLIFHSYGAGHCACECRFKLKYVLTKDCFRDGTKETPVKGFVVNGNMSRLATVKE